MVRAIAMSLMLAVSTSAWAGGIAVVDFQRAVNETTEGKAAQERLDTMYATRKSEIERLQAELESELQEYQSRAMILSDSARAEAEQELMTKQQRFEGLYMQYQQEMQQAYLSLLQDLDEKMRALSETIAREAGFDLVIDRAAVIYVGPGSTDMTDTLITRYNQRGG